MRWKQHTTRVRLYPDYISAYYIIDDAYEEGYINWDVFRKAEERIKSNKNGSWMFGESSEQIDFSKGYCPALDELAVLGQS